jgi:transcriptional regulator of arginine metabolism
VPDKRRRHAAILRLVRSQKVPSQERLREILAEEGVQVTQATLSRDVRALGVVKVADSAGQGYYALPGGLADTAPDLAQLLPSLFVSVDRIDNLLVLKTMPGGAQPVAAAIDHQDWDDVAGTIAGDDTILLITRTADAGEQVRQRLADQSRAESI